MKDAAMDPQIAIGILSEGIADGPELFEQTLRELRIPRLAISSASFRPKDPEVLRSFGIDNVVLPGTAHYLMMERPVAFNAELARAIARVPR